MRRLRVRPPALAGVALCLSSAGLAVAACAAESETCAAVTRDLRGEIEDIKQLRSAPVASLTAPRKHPAEPPQQMAAREREQAEVLNRMLPGMGCPPLDIDSELAQPANPALRPPAPGKRKNHQHWRVPGSG